MKAEKTVVCRIEDPTNKKQGILEEEYRRVRDLAELRKKNLDFLPLYDKIKNKIYSATVQAFDKYCNGDNDWNWYLRNDTFKVEKSKDTEKFDYWAKIPVKDVRGGVEVPIKPHTEIKEDMDIKDSKIIKKDYGFELHLSVVRSVEVKTSYSSVLAVDLGEKKYATAVLSSDGKPRFYGEDIRGIRRHYAWLRRRLQKKRCMGKIKEMGNKERRTVEDKLHKISRKIVEGAKETDSLIVLGELKGIREQDEGKKMNRITSQWAYFKLTKMIEYKAKWEEILVIRVSEKDTNKRCHRCGSMDTSRPSQGRFKCHNCGLDHYNADLNGAKNILKRFSAYMVENGAEVDQPETQAFGHKVLRSDIQVDDLGSPFLTNDLGIEFPNLKNKVFQEVS